MSFCKKNEVVHKADEAKVVGYIVEITGLTKTDSVVRHIYNYFDAVRQYLPNDFSASGSPKSNYENESASPEKLPSQDLDRTSRSEQELGLSYHINIVLPETENQMVFDAIFKSIKRNLL